MTAGTLAKTPLYVLHLELGAKMMPLAGHNIPVQYLAGVLKRHLHTREQAGLFDVSHIGQTHLMGAGAALALESPAPANILDLPVGRQRYASFIDEQGEILDDLMVANLSDYLLLVVNAAYKHQDLTYLHHHLEDRCSAKPLFKERVLFALQGPAVVRVLKCLVPQVAQVTFIQFVRVELFGQDRYVSRSDYTGEGDYEISVPVAHAEVLTRRLLAEPEAAPVGFGARDSLHLETGLCLYGHNIDSAITPVEVSPNWVISKARRADGMCTDGFPGTEWIFAQQAQDVTSKHVGPLPQGRMPVHEDVEIANAQGRVIDKVNSGGLGLSLDTPLAMDHMPNESTGLGSEVTAMVRGKPIALMVSRMSFVTQCYYRG